MERLRRQLVKAFNESELPLEAKYYVIKDIYRDVEAAYHTKLLEMEENNNEQSASDN